jgi:serine/threonine protein kinase
MSESVILNNRYQLEARKGTGGMAMVYRARDLMLERTVAIKLLRKDFSDKPNFREHFRQEAKAAANLSHPNIVTIHDFGIHEEQLFIVMEYVSGIDLKSLIKQQGELELSEAIDLMIQACAGVGYAHRAGLVHCDIKPQNMLVTPDKRLKVVDFGIARALATISPDEKTDVVWGSPQYFSPEQAAGAAPSPASDVYSLGVVLYELLTGQLPFTANNSKELARMHREALAPSPRKIKPELPISIERIILKVLSKEPASRYRTAGQFGQVLENFNQDNTSNKQNSNEVQPSAEEKQTVQPQMMPLPRPEATLGHVTAQQPPKQPLIQASVKTRKSTIDFDWATWILALLALITAGGLIPFWLWVYFVVNPPF